MLILCMVLLNTTRICHPKILVRRHFCITQPNVCAYWLWIVYVGSIISYYPTVNFILITWKWSFTMQCAFIQTMTPSIPHIQRSESLLYSNYILTFVLNQLCCIRDNHFVIPLWTVPNFIYISLVTIRTPSIIPFPSIRTN